MNRIVHGDNLDVPRCLDAVSPTGKETGYATEEPLGILERIVRVHSNPGDLVLDLFAGSGTTGMAAAMHGPEFPLADEARRRSR